MRISVAVSSRHTSFMEMIVAFGPSIGPTCITILNVINQAPMNPLIAKDSVAEPCWLNPDVWVVESGTFAAMIGVTETKFLEAVARLVTFDEVMLIVVADRKLGPKLWLKTADRLPVIARLNYARSVRG
jgi:hypothetical protein